jgi:hypothetical protein
MSLTKPSFSGRSARHAASHNNAPEAQATGSELPGQEKFYNYRNGFF